jgi:acetylornithine deacetylase/succinyl-diaminopimelate desuccinylase-like protein
VNSIAEEAWMEIDMRSSDKDSLETVRAKIELAVKDAARQENERWQQRSPVAVKLDLVGVRPPGVTSLNAPLVQAAVAATKYFQEDAPPGESSNDANYPRSLGIPSIGMGGGGRPLGGHSENESWDSTDSWIGTQRVLLLIAALVR